ncbi:MAG: lysophospholipase, partial [Actinomycetota bacterium]|nr:lysophospholipase [Actinomycetota bacterium]
MRQLVLAVVALVGVLLVVIWAVQRRLIYLPSPGPVPPAQDALEGAREVTLQTSDGLELGAWFLSGRSRANGMTVLVANGNAGDRSLRSPLAKALGREGFTVLLFDYRGYGGNSGQPSEDGLARDVRAAYRFLTEDEGIRPDRLIYFGESLGAAVVTELATEHPPGGLVLRSPFSDLAAVGRVHYPFLPINLLLRDRFPVLEHIR